MSSRRSLSVRTRFEIFKRDDFQCRYCGRRSPEVVLEVDHLIAVANGGSDDSSNLVTACWECNSGKSDKPLSEVLNGEHLHDSAILLLEQERQLREYDAVLGEVVSRRDRAFHELADYFCYMNGIRRMGRLDASFLRGFIVTTAPSAIKLAMDMALSKGKLQDMRYTCGILKKWRAEPGRLLQQEPVDTSPIDGRAEDVVY